MLGITETISSNLDFIFRYLYLIAYVLFLGSEFIFLSPNKLSYSTLTAFIVVSLIFGVALFVSLIQYRKKVLNVDTVRAFKFYLFCRCFKTKQMLESFD